MFLGADSREQIRKDLLLGFEHLEGTSTLENRVNEYYNLIQEMAHQYKRGKIPVLYHAIEKFEERFGPHADHPRIFSQFIYSSRNYKFRLGVRALNQKHDLRKKIGLICEELNLFIPIEFNNRNYSAKFFCPTVIYWDKYHKSLSIETQCDIQDYFDRYNPSMRKHLPILIKEAKTCLSYLGHPEMEIVPKDEETVYLVGEGVRYSFSFQRAVFETMTRNLSQYLNYVLNSQKSVDVY